MCFAAYHLGDGPVLVKVRLELVCENARVHGDWCDEDVRGREKRLIEATHAFCCRQQAKHKRATVVALETLPCNEGGTAHPRRSPMRGLRRRSSCEKWVRGLEGHRFSVVRAARHAGALLSPCLCAAQTHTRPAHRFLLPFAPHTPSSPRVWCRCRRGASGFVRLLLHSSSAQVCWLQLITISSLLRQSTHNNGCLVLCALSPGGLSIVERGSALQTAIELSRYV